MRPKDASAAHGLLTRAELLQEQGQNEEAKRVLRELFSSQPEHVGGRVLLARLHAAAGARRLAIGVLEEVLGTDPTHLAGSLLLATLLAEEGQWRQARALLDQSGTLAPGDPRVAELRARLQEQTTLSKLRGEDPFDRPSVADRLEGEGRLQAALEVWERLAGEHPEESRLRERVEALSARLEAPPEGKVAPLRGPAGAAAQEALRRLLRGDPSNLG